MAASIIAPPLHSDIVITKDDMILNGKILEDKKPEHIVFANYHGTFTIRYKLIKELHRTDSFEEDIEVFKDMGKNVSETEIKKNYLAGEVQLEKRLRKNEEKFSAKRESLVLMLELSGNKTFGDLSPVLPYSVGAALSAEFPVNTPRLLRDNYLYGADTEAGWFYSDNSNRKNRGFYTAAGPLWQIPAGISDFKFSFNISALLGAGWYSAVNSDVDRETSAFKWNISFHAGPVFMAGRFLFSTGIHLNYIHDRAAPMSGAGLTVCAGYAF